MELDPDSQWDNSSSPPAAGHGRYEIHFITAIMQSSQLWEVLRRRRPESRVDTRGPWDGDVLHST